jgi:hypothetical protein
MSEVAHAVTLATAKAAAVSAGWKWIAVLIALGVLVLLYLFTIVSSRSWNPWKLVEGADGSASTSKLQWFVWLTVIIFAYAVLWVLRAKQGNYSAISDVPVNLLTVLGFSTGTAAAAKGITSGYVQTGRVAKTTAKQNAAAQAAAGKQGAAAAASKGGILTDDNGTPELAKIQMMGFTLIAVGVFLATVIHQIVSNPVSTSLPNIDSSLLVLMGISQGGYLGKKLVTFGAPVLYPPKPPGAPPGTGVTLPGANLGSSAGSQLTLNDQPTEARWSPTEITFTVPENDPASGARWENLPKTVQLAVSAMGQMSNSVPFTVTAPPANPPVDHADA